MLLKEMIYELYGIDGDCYIKPFEVDGITKPQFRFANKDSLEKVKFESFIGIIHTQFIVENDEKIKNDFIVFRELNGSSKYYFEDVYTERFINWMIENKSEYQRKWKAFHFDFKDQSDWIDLGEKGSASVLEGYKDIGDNEYSITLLSKRTIKSTPKTFEYIKHQILNFILLNTKIQPKELKTIYYKDDYREEEYAELFSSFKQGYIGPDYLIKLHKKVDGELVEKNSFMAKRVFDGE